MIGFNAVAAAATVAIVLAAFHGNRTTTGFMLAHRYLKSIMAAAVTLDIAPLLFENDAAYQASSFPRPYKEANPFAGIPRGARPVVQAADTAAQRAATTDLILLWDRARLAERQLKAAISVSLPATTYELILGHEANTLSIAETWTTLFAHFARPSSEQAQHLLLAMSTSAPTEQATPLISRLDESFAALEPTNPVPPQNKFDTLRLNLLRKANCFQFLQNYDARTPAADKTYDNLKRAVLDHVNLYGDFPVGNAAIVNPVTANAAAATTDNTDLSAASTEDLKATRALLQSRLKAIQRTLRSRGEGGGQQEPRDQQRGRAHGSRSPSAERANTWCSTHHWCRHTSANCRDPSDGHDEEETSDPRAAGSGRSRGRQNPSRGRGGH